MRWLLVITGFVAPFFLIKYREQVGDMIGEAAWMKKIGGVHYTIIYIAIAIFFIALAEATGTTRILFGPLIKFLPGMQQSQVQDVGF